MFLCCCCCCCCCCYEEGILDPTCSSTSASSLCLIVFSKHRWCIVEHRQTSPIYHRPSQQFVFPAKMRDFSKITAYCLLITIVHHFLLKIASTDFVAVVGVVEKTTWKVQKFFYRFWVVEKSTFVITLSSFESRVTISIFFSLPSNWFFSITMFVFSFRQNYKKKIPFQKKSLF